MTYLMLFLREDSEENLREHFVKGVYHDKTLSVFRTR